MSPSMSAQARTPMSVFPSNVQPCDRSAAFAPRRAPGRYRAVAAVASGKAQRHRRPDGSRARDLLQRAAGQHQGGGGARQRRAFLRRPRPDRAQRAQCRAGDRTLAHVAPRVRTDRIRPPAGGGGAAWRGGRRRPGVRGGGACARRRALGLLRAAGRQPRHLCGRRRFGAVAAPHRRLARDGNDADRTRL